jgi:hypothetical protein
MDPLNDTEMGSVTGQEGILVSLDYYYNSKPLYKDDATVRAEGRGADDIGAANADCTGLASVNCRLALQLENRDFGWLVFKNGHASLEMNRLSLDASLLGGVPNGVSTENKDIALNDEKFRAESPDGGTTPGDCLLGTGNCVKPYIDKMPGVRAHYPESGGSYDHSSRTTTGYNDVRLGVHVEGLAIEYNEPDPAAGENFPTQPGWQSDNFGSFLGFEIADNNAHQAGIAIGGNFYMYGF